MTPEVLGEGFFGEGFTLADNRFMVSPLDSPFSKKKKGDNNRSKTGPGGTTTSFYSSLMPGALILHNALIFNIALAKQLFILSLFFV
uniref:Uncharacterized protein n=1 Tax=Aegilops tauschii TaxID=37682 RepID=M8BCI3_AEGTA